MLVYYINIQTDERQWRIQRNTIKCMVLKNFVLYISIYIYTQIFFFFEKLYTQILINHNLHYMLVYYFIFLAMIAYVVLFYKGKTVSLRSNIIKRWHSYICMHHILRAPKNLMSTNCIVLEAPSLI